MLQMCAARGSNIDGRHVHKSLGCFLVQIPRRTVVTIGGTPRTNQVEIRTRYSESHHAALVVTDRIGGRSGSFGAEGA